MILVYIVCKDKKEASSIGKRLLTLTLVGCVNMHPITSMYLWKGKIEEASEVVLLCKTEDKKIVSCGDRHWRTASIRFH